MTTRSLFLNVPANGVQGYMVPQCVEMFAACCKRGVVNMGRNVTKLRQRSQWQLQNLCDYL